MTKQELKKAREVLPLDQLLTAAGTSVFRLARMAMVRAMEIHNGSPPQVEHFPEEKETTIALREIAQGKMGVKKKTSS